MWVNARLRGAGPVLGSFSRRLVALWLWASWFTSLYVSFLTHEVEIRLAASFIGLWGSPGGSDGKESACNAGDLGSVPGLRRSPGEGNGYPLQYSCLENAMDRGAWWVTVHGVTKSWTRLSDKHFHLHWIVAGIKWVTVHEDFGGDWCIIAKWCHYICT